MVCACLQLCDGVCMSAVCDGVCMSAVCDGVCMSAVCDGVCMSAVVRWCVHVCSCVHVAVVCTASKL